MRTLSESMVTNALEERQIRKADRLKRFAFREGASADCTQGTDTREVHAGNMHTLSESIAANALEQQVRKADRVKRFAFLEGASRRLYARMRDKRSPRSRDAHTQQKLTTQRSRAG